MKTKTVYLYNDKNEYCGTYESHESPLEPGVFITPERCLEQKPSYGKHEIAIAENGVWVIYPDYRGEKYYDDTGKEMVITEAKQALPVNFPVNSPSESLISPKWDGGGWVESAILYDGQVVKNKANVLAIIEQKIISYLADVNCTSLEIFLDNKTKLLKEANDFIIAQNLE